MAGFYARRVLGLGSTWTTLKGMKKTTQPNREKLQQQTSFCYEWPH